jgi:hypothetical protein
MIGPFALWTASPSVGDRPRSESLVLESYDRLTNPSERRPRVRLYCAFFPCTVPTYRSTFAVGITGLETSAPGAPEIAGGAPAMGAGGSLGNQIR